MGKRRASSRSRRQSATSTNVTRPDCRVTPDPTRPTRPTRPFRYFDLPGEIRNRIMDFALYPGHVDVCERAQATSGSLPGFQLLAASKQAYSEGHAIFYSKNSFQLPYGSHFWRYQHKHVTLMRRVTLRCGYSDLLNNQVLQSFKHPDQDSEIDRPRQYCAPRLGWILKRKLSFVLENLRDLEELKVVFPGFEDILWYDGKFDRASWTRKTVSIAVGTRTPPVLTTEYTINGVVTLSFTRGELLKQLHGIDLEGCDIKGWIAWVMDGRLLPVAMQYAARMADLRLGENSRLGERRIIGDGQWVARLERLVKEEETKMKMSRMPAPVSQGL